MLVSSLVLLHGICTSVCSESGCDDITLCSRVCVFPECEQKGRLHWQQNWVCRVYWWVYLGVKNLLTPADFDGKPA